MDDLGIELLVVDAACTNHLFGLHDEEAARACVVVEQLTRIAGTHEGGDARQTVEVLLIRPDKRGFHGLHQRLQLRHLLGILLVELIDVDDGKLHQLSLGIALC